MTTDVNKDLLGMKTTIFGLLRTVQKNVTEMNTISGTLGSLMGRTKRLRAGRAKGSRTARKANTKTAKTTVATSSENTAAQDGDKNVASTGNGPADDKAAEMKRMTEQMNEWMKKVEEETKRLETENALMTQQLSKIAVNVKS
ncbi:uncharacterized protein LOC144914667 [Branchiostoma floridae x Branchiostoma belcheri]|nr:hypothetical protein Bbelb_359310 [Branchiostoma belcheri]